MRLALMSLTLLSLSACFFQLDAVDRQRPAGAGSDGGATPIGVDAADVVLRSDSAAGCVGPGVIFCDTFDRDGPPERGWTALDVMRGGASMTLDDTLSASPPKALRISLPRSTQETAAVLRLSVPAVADRRFVLAFDVRVTQPRSREATIVAFWPEDNDPRFDTYWYSFQVFTNEFASNQGAFKDGISNPASKFSFVGGNPAAWTHIELEYTVDDGRVRTRVNGVERSSAALPPIATSRVSFFLGPNDGPNPEGPWVMHFDNVSLRR